jgi:hypothetical protein
MGEDVHGRGIGADIGRGGARESSRQSGRNAEKHAACQSERGTLPNSASPPRGALSPATTAAAKSGSDNCPPACAPLRLRGTGAVSVAARWGIFLASFWPLPALKLVAGSFLGASAGASSCQPRSASRHVLPDSLTIC